MTASVVPIFSSEHTSSREDGVSLGIVSCHPAVFSVTASGDHHSLACESQSMLNFISSANLTLSL